MTGIDEPGVTARVARRVSRGTDDIVVTSNRHRPVASGGDAAAVATPIDSLPVVVERFEARRRTLRVAVVTETWPPEVNGVAMSIARVVAGLQARDHAIQLVRPRQHADEEREPDAGLEAVLTRGLPIPNYPNLRLGVPARRALVRLWSERRPDVVHIATEGPLGWSALQAATHLRLPTSSDFRTNFHAYSGHYGVGWLRRPIAAYLRRFHNRTRLTMVPTDGLRRELAASGFRNLAVVGRGVDTDRFHPGRRDPALRAAWGAGPDDPVLIHVGRVAAEKNLGLLVRTYARIRAVSPRARLVLVGDGPMVSELRALCPDAVFCGTRSGDELAAHYASGDVFLFPSLTETFGNVTSEALASGLAVVAFGYAAAAQLIRDGVDGSLVSFGDEVAFEAAAVRVVTDGALRVRVRAAAPDAVARLGWSGVVERLETLLLGLAAP
jgi:glycosyltransferase involved in cell wall biosynthesis